MTPEITPRIELNHDPLVYLVRDEEWTCPQCQEHYGLDEEGRERACVTCMIKKSGNTSIMLFGWHILKTSRQIIAKPPKHRVDGK